MSLNFGAQTARRDVVADFRIFRIFEICGSESSFAPPEEMVRNARIDSMIIDQCMAIHSGIYLDSIILINHHYCMTYETHTGALCWHVSMAPAGNLAGSYM